MSEQVLRQSSTQSRNRVRKMTQIGMLCAISYLVMVVGRIPIVLFLKYDPKDVIIAIGGFIFGPLTAFVISTIVSLVEMFTVSETGFWGLVMNVLSTCAFACTASIIYKKNHTIKGAVIGLLAGGALMTGIMLLWNYLITPMYMGYPREAVAAMLVPVFLPFNLIKMALNTAITLLIYKPVVTALRKARLLPPSGTEGKTLKTKKGSIGLILSCGVVLATCVLFVLVLQGVI